MKRWGYILGAVAVAAGVLAAATYFFMAPTGKIGKTTDASYRWEQVPLPSAGFTTVLTDVPGRKGVLYAGGDVHGFKYTDNSGDQWELRNSSLWRAGSYGVAALAPHPSKPGKLYMLSGRGDKGKEDYGFYASEDDGKTWTLLHKNLIPAKPQASNPELRVYGKLIALDASGSQDILYVASYDKGLFKSIDGGKTFEVVGLAGSLGKDKEHANLTSVVLDPSNPRRIFVGVRYDATGRKDKVFRETKAGGGVWMSEDAGASWKEVFTGVPVRDLAIDPQDPQHIYAACLDKGMYRSADGGKTWNLINNGLPLTTPGKTKMYYNTVTVNPHRKGEVLAGTGIGQLNSVYGSIYRSTDEGRSWSDIVRKDGVHADPGLFIPAFYDIGGRGYAVSSIVIPAWDANTIVVAGRAGVWRSDDNGANWHTIFNGLQGRRMLSAAIQPGTSRFYFGMVDFAMGTYDAVSRKFDPVDVKEILDTKERYIAVAVDAVKTKIMAGMGNQYANEGNYGTVIASTDGEHWMRKDQGLPGKRVSGLKMAPSRPDTVYAALNGAGIYKSTNGGESWTAASHGLPGVGSLFSSFTRVPVAVHPQNPDIVYVLDDSQGVFRSADGGASWQKEIAGIKPAAKLRYGDLAIDPTAPDTVYVGTSEGLYRSTDGGSHWEPAAIPHTGEISAITVSPVNGAVFAAAEADPSSPADTIPGVYMSADKGATWTAIYADGLAGLQFDALLLDPGHPDDLYATVRTASMIKLSKR